MSRFASRPDDGAIAPRGGRPAPRRPRGATFARLVGGAGLLALTAALFWLLTDESFRVDETSVRFAGLVHADEAELRPLLQDLERGPNVFRVRAADIVRELSTLPGVDAASATITLPSDVRIELDEREPLFVWTDGTRSWLVDEAGMLFSPGDAVTSPDAAADEGAASEDPARAALPAVRDERGTEALAADGRLGAIDMAVMRQLLALTPELLESDSDGLRLRVDPGTGYVLESDEPAWSAIFGHYTPRVHPPETVPRQVQCLHWLLARAEPRLDYVWLTPSDEGCGAFSRYQDGSRRRG